MVVIYFEMYKPWVLDPKVGYFALLEVKNGSKRPILAIFRFWNMTVSGPVWNGVDDEI